MLYKLRALFKTLSATTLFLLALFSPAQASEDIDTSVVALIDASFSEKSDLINTIVASEHPRTIKILSSMLEGDLYYLKNSTNVVIAIEEKGSYKAEQALSGAAVEVASKRALKKIRVNNTLRGQLRSAIAELNLTSKDAEVRRQAVADLIGKADESLLPQIKRALEKESDAKIAAQLSLVVAMIEIESDDQATRLHSIETLADNVTPEARGLLNQVLEKDDEGAYIEKDREVRNAAKGALEAMDSAQARAEFAETVFFGLSLGSVLLLAAIGLAITFGVMGVINMAHGEMMMIGAYTTYVIQQLLPNHIDYSLFIAVPTAFVVAGLVGILIERGVIQFLYGRPLETLLATFGISLILQQLARTIFSPLNRSVETPSWMSGAWEINSMLSITYNRLYIIIFSIIVFLMLIMLLKKTALGLHVRAVSQNRAMARAMGVRSGWVDAMTFGLGSGIAGVAGVALSQLTNVGPNLGQAYIIDSFMVVVFGGVGNLWGTFVAAMSLGVLNKIMEPWAGAVLAKILLLVFIILFIQKRPRGLFPQKGRSAEA